MAAIPAPTTGLQREEWEDADFDIPEGLPLHSLDTESDKDDDGDEDWDMEMEMGQTGGAKAKAVFAGMKVRSQSFGRVASSMITIRQPLPQATVEEDEDDEGVSTIKVATLLKPIAKSPAPPVDDDMESAFALPSDLTQLSLAQVTLNHRSSKNSLEWGEKDQTSSSQSSDAYSNLGFADASPSSNSATSASLPDTESEGEEEDSELDGLVIPAVFESGQGGQQLKKMLEQKKKVQFKEDDQKITIPNPEDDFEIGLVIDDEADLSPSKLMLNAQQPRAFNRSKSAPVRPPMTTRPLSRIKSDRAKSPTNPPPSSTRQFQRLKPSVSPPLKATRSQSFKEVSPSTSPTSFLSPKPGSLRGQKSHTGLKPASSASTQRKLARKASLSSLIEMSQSQASGSGTPSPPTTGLSTNKLARYEIPTAASRAKSHTSSASRIHGLEHIVPPTRPSTPSSNPIALRLTMPTSMRMKSRPALSSVFPSPLPASRATSPLPPRPPSSLRSRSRQGLDAPQASAPKVLRRPKRQRTYGDGTELDGIADLHTDREQEGRFRVAPKGYGNRVPGGTYSSIEKDTLRKKGHNLEGTSGSAGLPLTSATNTLKRTGHIEFPSAKGTDPLIKKKKKNASSPTTKRKPTLIRNLGGVGGPKVVGDMKWNPSSLRWEGNDQVLRDFDAAVGTSTRPALITHLTGSSIGSPVGSFTSGARKVGNMIFDPTRMCWISTLAPEDDEPDVFADLADDEEDGDGWETKGGTIRASQQQAGASSDTSGNSSTVVQAPSPAPSRTRTMSESGSDRGSRASIVYDVDDSFLEHCRTAEERHRTEMKGWKFKLRDPFAEPDRTHLYEVRALATRKY